MSVYGSMSRLERYYRDKYGRYRYPGSYFSPDRYWPAVQYHYYDEPLYNSREWYLEPWGRSLYRSLYGSTSEYGYRSRYYDKYRQQDDYWYDYYPRYSRYMF